MLILTALSFSRSVKFLLVNCAPWSVLNTSGLPYRRRACSRASTQKSASRVLDRRQERTLRLCQSIMATRYINPWHIGMYVMSAAHTWLGRSIFRFLNKYGYTLCSGCGRDVLGLG